MDFLTSQRERTDDNMQDLVYSPTSDFSGAAEEIYVPNNNQTFQYPLTQPKIEEERKRLQDEIQALKDKLEQYKISYDKRNKDLQRNYNDLQESHDELTKMYNHEKYQGQISVQKLNSEIKGIKQQNEELDQFKSMYEKRLTNLQSDHDILQEKFEDLMSKSNNEKKQHQITVHELNNEIKGIKEKNIKKMKEISDEINQKHQSKIDLQEQRIQHLQRSLEFKDGQSQIYQSVDSENDNLRRKNVNLEDQLDKLSNENHDLARANQSLEIQVKNLAQKNASLENEASDYQSALGMATNTQLGDDPVKLKNDISELNDHLKRYVTNLKADVTVNREEVQKLLLLYGCPTKIGSQKNDRFLIQAVLQRHVMETIFSAAAQYFRGSGKYHYLESDIVSRESWLSTLLTCASKYRVGTDDLTLVASTKLRQQIYSVLSYRGFSDILKEDNNSTFEHPFITQLTKELNEIMNDLRIIDDDQKRANSENLAATIIREAVKIFWFKLKAQDPIVQYTWIPYNARVDKARMEGGNLEDDADLYVDLCHFPLMGSNLASDKQILYSLAKVIVQPRDKYPF